MRRLWFPVLFFMAFAHDDDFLFKIPHDGHGDESNMECRWVSYTTWFGFCHPQSCPTSFFVTYEDVAKSNAKILSIFDHMFGEVTPEELEDYKRAENKFTTFGMPCFTGGHKTLCCKTGFFHVALANILNKKK